MNSFNSNIGLAYAAEALQTQDEISQRPISDVDSDLGSSLSSIFETLPLINSACIGLVGNNSQTELVESIKNRAKHEGLKTLGIRADGLLQGELRPGLTKRKLKLIKNFIGKNANNGLVIIQDLNLVSSNDITGDSSSDLIEYLSQNIYSAYRTVPSERNNANVIGIGQVGFSQLDTFRKHNPRRISEILGIQRFYLLDKQPHQPDYTVEDIKPLF